MGGADLSKLLFQGFSGSSLLEQNLKVLTLRRSGCEKHPAALWLHFIWLPSCCHAAKVTLWTRRTFCLSSLLLFLHRENLCCSSSCQEQVLRGSQWLGRCPAGNGGQPKRLRRAALLPACSIEMAWTSPTSNSPPPTFFVSTFLFFWHWFERKKHQQNELKKSGWNVFLFSHTFILHRIIRLFVASNGKLDDRYSNIISV